MIIESAAFRYLFIQIMARSRQKSRTKKLWDEIPNKMAQWLPGKNELLIENNQLELVKGKPITYHITTKLRTWFSHPNIHGFWMLPGFVLQFIKTNPGAREGLPVFHFFEYFDFVFTFFLISTVH